MSKVPRVIITTYYAIRNLYTSAYVSLYLERERERREDKNNYNSHYFLVYLNAIVRMVTNSISDVKIVWFITKPTNHLHIPNLGKQVLRNVSNVVGICIDYIENNVI